MPHHHAQHAQNVGPNLFTHNENSAYVMPHVTVHAVTSMRIMQHMHAGKLAAPMYTWRTRNYLWTRHMCQLNYIYQN